ncbi:hypothetical protein BDZ97DRAFT_1763905 [Flammula alnicola]|nr:hypothetical protein BDZ97DRAFT_1763905 [Flammula alnicola]
MSGPREAAELVCLRLLFVGRTWDRRPFDALGDAIVHPYYPYILTLSNMGLSLSGYLPRLLSMTLWAFQPNVLRWENLLDVSDTLDMLYNTSVEILESKKAFTKDDNALVSRIDQEKDITSVSIQTTSGNRVIYSMSADMSASAEDRLTIAMYPSNASQP